MTAQPHREEPTGRPVTPGPSGDGAQLPWLCSWSRIGALSCREREVFCLLAQGYSNTEIGGRLFITERTVRAHLTNIVDKLALRTRLEVCLLAAAHRLLAEDPQPVPEGER